MGRSTKIRIRRVKEINYDDLCCFPFTLRVYMYLSVDHDFSFLRWCESVWMSHYFESSVKIKVRSAAHLLAIEEYSQ
jgi:hypothetical protein